MLNSAPRKSRPDAPSDDAARPGLIESRQPSRPFGPREQQSALEAAYATPEPAVFQYSGAVKLVILATGCLGSWAAVLAVVRFAGGH
jgi:hypothetical protein